jgi:hypothetical protein
MGKSRALALELQNEEDERAQRAYDKRELERAAQRRREKGHYDERRWHGHGQQQDRKAKKEKEKESCVIM